MPSTNYTIIEHVVTLLKKHKEAPFSRYDAAATLKMHDRTALRLLQVLMRSRLIKPSRKGRITLYEVTQALVPNKNSHAAR